ADRIAYLASCHPMLRAEVEAYIRSYEASSGFLEQPAASIRASVTEDIPGLAGKRFGPYRALSLLGHGGVGSAWLAGRAAGLFTRQVGLKPIPTALAGGGRD